MKLTNEQLGYLEILLNGTEEQLKNADPEKRESYMKYLGWVKSLVQECRDYRTREGGAVDSSKTSE